jgi:hypothetical protein
MLFKTLAEGEFPSCEKCLYSKKNLIAAGNLECHEAPRARIWVDEKDYCSAGEWFTYSQGSSNKRAYFSEIIASLQLEEERAQREREYEKLRMKFEFF